MWPQFFEDLRPVVVGVGGASRANGFTITVGFAVSGNNWEVWYASPEHSEAEATDWPVVALATALVLVACWLHAWTLLILLWLLAAQGGMFMRRFKSWHWCEHQVVALLQEDITPTEGLLRSQSAVAVRCGSLRHSLPTLAKAALLACVAHWFLYESWMISLILFVSSICGILALSSRTLYGAGRPGLKAIRVSGYLGLPALLIGLAIERMFYLRKPDRKQQELALQWGQQAAALLNKLKLKESAAPSSASS